MTSGEKSVVSKFLVLAKAYTGNGYRDSLKEAFVDDVVPSETLQVSGTNLPLAYMVDEDELSDTLSDEQSTAPILKPLVLVIGTALSPEEMALLTRVLASAGLALGGNCVFVEGAVDALEDEIRWNMPKAVLCLGDFSVPGQYVPVVSTCHPRELLKNEALKRRAFADMKELMLILAKANSAYVEENRELLKKYADADTAFAASVLEFLS